MTNTASTLETQSLLEHTTDVVVAYANNNAISPADLPKLIIDTYAALVLLQKGEAAEPAASLLPAIPIKKSITPEFLFCLEDGKKFKSLKRHLRTHHQLTPEQYREKWGLPRDYPMTAPGYSATRSALAKAHGLGRTGKAPVVEAAPARAPRKKLGLKSS